MRLSDLTPQEIRSYFESRGVKFQGEKVQQLVRCVLHPDRNPSLSIDYSKGVWKCFSRCGEGGLIDFEQQASNHTDRKKALRAIFEAVGQEYELGVGNEEEPEMIYSYVDEYGHMLFQKLRFAGVDSEGKKRFVFRKPGKNGGWLYSAKEIRKVLYNLPAVITANQVAILEGERDTENFNRLNLSALDSTGFSRITGTTNYDGGKNWDVSYSRYFTGKDVIIIPDFDKTGIDRIGIVGPAVFQYAHTVKVVQLPLRNEHDDLTVYLRDHNAKDLLKEIQAAPLWTPHKNQILVSAVEFLAKGDTEIEWLVIGLIQRRANGFVVASPKVGKSFMSLDLSIAMALGREWMGFSIPQRTKVAYISREDTPALTKWRLRKLLENWKVTDRDVEEYLYFNSKDQSPQFKLDNSEQFNEMLAELKQFKPEIVILDVLNVMHSQEENDNTEMRKVMDKADQLGQELECSIAVLHHFNKEVKARLTERIRGASAMAGWVEWVIGLHKEDEDDENNTMRYAEFDLKAVSPPKNLYFRIEGYDSMGYKVMRGENPENIKSMALVKCEKPASKKRKAEKVVSIGTQAV